MLLLMFRAVWVNFKTSFALLFLPAANEVCESYVFTGVCLSTGAGRVCPSGMHIPHGTHNPPPQACTSPRHTQPSRHAHTPGMHAPPGHARPRQILRDALNERAVRILLECILVFIKVYILFAKCKRNNCNHISHFVGRLWQKF